jgi:NitT/TauT family transport system substrate-binding protein
VPEITDADAPTQRAVLDASIALWKSEGPLGHSDPAAWATSVEFMRAADLIAADVEVESLYTNKLLEP